MPRNLIRRPFMRVVVLAVAWMMISPLSGADDYEFLYAGPSDSFPSSAKSSLGIPMDLTEDSEDSHDHCTCCVCALALGESFSPEIFSPMAGELLAAAPVRALCSTFLSDIYRPPIA